MIKKILLLTLLAAIPLYSQFSSAITESQIRGSRPASLNVLAGNFPNEQALIDLIWAPGVDRGYVMQGMAVHDTFVLISAYKSKSVSVNLGPTRVFKVDIASGNTVGFFDLSRDVRHAGGLAYIDENRIVVADTYRLYDIDLNVALAQGNTKNAVNGRLILSGSLRGSGLAFDGVNLVTIGYDAEKESRAYYLPLSLFQSHNDERITEQQATRFINIERGAQGATFSPNGDIWISYGGSTFGKVNQTNPLTGEIINSYDLVAGLEDVGFSSEDKLWAMSESGAIRFQKSLATKLPVVFSMDINKMKAFDLD